MFFFFFDTKNVKIEFGSSPKESELAIVSIDQYGNLGELNSFVLKEYGYSQDILKKLDLEKGYDLFQINHKPILFIVTISNVLVSEKDSTKFNLSTNLSKAIDHYFDFFRGRSIWIPLMGTGSGGLTMNESFDSIINVLKLRLLKIEKYNCTFNISIPDNDEGLKLYNNIVENNNSNLQVNTSKENLIKRIQDFNVNYFLVGTTWDNVEQADRFYQESIWENGYEDGRYSNIINEVKINDILIHKSPYSNRRGESILRIKAFGIVESISEDGKKLKVDWLIKFDQNLDVIGLGFFRDTISRLDQDNLIIILNSFGQEALKFVYDIINNYFINNNSFVSNKSKIVNNNQNSTKLAGLIADVDNGEDYLDIKNDVVAFARVMAAKSFQPPLAIALLGKWGSGKSFFMRKLKENIQFLSNNNPQEAFCEGVVHVHFNAWSYMDANLWASIVTRIFEGLDEYINGLNLSQKEKKKIENELFQKLTISKEEHFELEKQQNQVKKRLQELKTIKKNIKRELNNKISSVRKSTLVDIINKIDSEFKVQEKIQKTLNDNPTFVDSAQKFENIVPKQYWENPSVFYNELKSIYAFLKTFFYRKKLKTNIFWILAFLILIGVTPVLTFLTNLLLSWHDFRISDKIWITITIIGTLFTRSIDTYLKLKKQIAPFWHLKEKYEKEKEEAIFKFKQEQKAIKLEISQKKEEIIQVNKEINTNLQLQANLSFKLENSLSTHALYTFIEKRANSEDYKKHLGIVSLIRKDFEILSGLLTDHQTDLVSNEDSVEFKKMFKEPLERIILYIDDLDRCPEERVVEVLEAVNLLMAFPLFVVVVGVDPRWVKKALQVKYKNQFSDEKVTQEAISTSNYLEKIFQIPFHLKDADDKSIKHMIEKLADTKTITIIDESIKTETNQEGKNNLQELTADNDVITADSESILINDKNGKKNNQSVEITNAEKIKALEISEKEIETIKSLTEIIGNNPRTIKRFINIYRIIKTHQDFNSQNEESILALIFLLSFSIGKYSLQFPELIVYINKGSFNSFDKLNNFFDYAIKQNKTKVTENDFIITNKFELLFEIIKENNSEVLDLDISLLEEQYNFIHRFTFKNI